MRRDPHRFRIGAFAIVGILLMLIGVVAVGMGRWWLREGRTVYCYFTESVSGISVGSPLKLQGVEVGQVSEVVLLPPRRLKRAATSWDSLIEVRCTVYPDAIGAQAGLVMTQEELTAWVNEQVGRGLRVTIKWKDITGQKYLSLDHYRLSEHPIPDIRDARPPFIPTAVEATFSDIQRDLATTLGKLARVDYEGIGQRVSDLLEDVRQQVAVLDTQSLQGHAEETLLAVRALAEDPALRRIIDRLDTMSESMTKTTQRVDELIHGDDLSGGLADFRKAAASLERTLAGLEKDVPGLVERVDQIAASAQNAIEAADVPGTTATVRDAAESIGGAADKVGGAMRQVSAMREELRRVMREVSVTSRSIQRLARSLEEQPGAILGGKRIPEETR